jgi:hypothetical protein
MSSACSTNGDKNNECRIFMGKPEGRRPLRIPGRKSVDNIKVDLREMGLCDADWIYLAQDREE